MSDETTATDGEQQLSYFLDNAASRTTGGGQDGSLGASRSANRVSYLLREPPSAVGKGRRLMGSRSYTATGKRYWAVRAATAIGVSLALLTATQVPANAATDPYAGGDGYDVSYPQCSSTFSPTGHSYNFAIIGVGGGRPFTANNCASAEVLAAQTAGITNRALYFNTGYAGAYARDISGPCIDDVSSDPVFGGLTGHALSQAEQAWEIGCSEALYAQSLHVLSNPTMWWADVETGNSWSTNTTLNDFTLEGISYEMQSEGAPGGGGFYSYAAAWAKIAGSGYVTPTPETANWDAFTGETFNTVSNEVVQDGTLNGVDYDLGY